jgi:hypothetical protein
VTVPYRNDQEAGVSQQLLPQRVRVVGDLYHGRIPAGSLYVGRPAPGLRGSTYRNRHRVGACRYCVTGHDQRDAAFAYARDLEADPELVAVARRELVSRDLACWRTTPPCHSDVFLLVAAGTAPLEALRQHGLREEAE